MIEWFVWFVWLVIQVGIELLTIAAVRMLLGLSRTFTGTATAISAGRVREVIVLDPTKGIEGLDEMDRKTTEYLE